MMKQLQKPPTIRVPRIDEIPNNSEISWKLNEMKNAKIEEGFILQENLSWEYPFKFYAEININNSRLWALFITLIDLLPNEVSCIYNLVDENPNFSTQLSKKEILEIIEDYRTELVQDCLLEVGIIFQSKNYLEEIFISNMKYLKFWGMNKSKFLQVMSNFELNEILDLNFIDEYPTVIEPLRFFMENVKHPETVIKELDEFFKNDKEKDKA